MIEKTIFLDDIDPRVLFGSKNILFDKLKQKFPKLKLIARGNELKVMGETQEIEFFLSRLDALIQIIQQKNNLTPEDLEQIMETSYTETALPLTNPEHIIIYGNHGKAVKAKTPNSFSGS